MHPVKRPKASDTEEDLIREQEEFLKGLQSRKIVPAAKVVKKSSPSSSTLTSSGDSQGQGHGQPHTTSTTSESQAPTGNQLIDFTTENVLFEVKERPFDLSKLQDFPSGSKKPPKVIKIQSGAFQAQSDQIQKNVTSATSSSTRKKSLFARSFDARKESRKSKKSEPDDVKDKSAAQQIPQVEGEVTMIQPDDLIGAKVHPYLAGMTSREILDEQQKLLERLDPKLVEFIRNRQFAKKGHVGGSSSTTTSVPLETETEPMEVQDQESEETPVDLDISDLPIDPKSVEKYPGMEKVELSKLAWAGVIKPIPPAGVVGGGQSSKVGKVSESRNARFDFNGYLMPPNPNEDLSTYDKALHHHGEEMDRPGYTISELITLARSMHPQQRSVALDTLANIYGLAHSGVYDDCLEQSVFNLLDFMEFIHVVRKGLDYTDSGSINSSLSCLGSLLYPEIEEACLDATYLWPHARPFPLMSTIPDEIRNEKLAGQELKDFQFLQLDLGEFLMTRSDILTRIQYLLTTKSQLVNERGVTSVLKILIRLARQSPEMVIGHGDLLRYIVENHISPNWLLLKERDKNLKGVPLVLALKFVRVLAESSTVNALNLYRNYGIMPSVMSYLAYDQWRDQSHVQEVEALILESFKIWLSFLSLGVAIDEYVEFFPVLMQFLRFYGVSSELNSFDLHHSAHLFSLLTMVVSFGEGDNSHSHWTLVKDAAPLIEQHCRKMIKILAAPHLEGTYNLDLALLSLGTGLDFLCRTLKYNGNSGISNRMGPLLLEFSRCCTYINLTSKLRSHSVLLENLSEDGNDKFRSRYPSNFAFIGALRWKGDLNPVMQSNSPFYFLSFFIAFARYIFRDFQHDETTLKSMTTILNGNVENYLAKLQTSQDQNHQDLGLDYFVRFELSCLSELLGFAKFLGKSEIFPVAYKTLAQVPSSCVEVFQNLLRVCLESCCAPKDLEVVYQFYKSYFLNANQKAEKNSSESENTHLSDTTPTTKNKTKVKFDDGGHPGDGRNETDNEKFLFEEWRQKMAEPHWIFHPLDNLYKRVVSTPGYVRDPSLMEMLEQEVRGCLSFIQSCLTHFCDSIVQTPQDLVTVYCRICRTFMMGTPNVYLDSTVTQILIDILQIIMNCRILSGFKDAAIFSKHKPSKSAAVTFYDFYSEFVSEYFDNSYFNETFAAYLFLPLRSPEEANVKSCFWGHEHLHCVRLTSDKIPSSSTQYLTKFSEKDPKMLTLFTNLLKRRVITKDKNPLLYEILTINLKNSLDSMTDELKKELNLLSL